MGTAPTPASNIIFVSYHIGQRTLTGNHTVPNASSVKINASQELTHLVSGEKNEREKNPDCQIYSEYPMRNLRYVYARVFITQETSLSC